MVAASSRIALIRIGIEQYDFFLYARRILKMGRGRFLVECEHKGYYWGNFYF